MCHDHTPSSSGVCANCKHKSARAPQSTCHLPCIYRLINYLSHLQTNASHTHTHTSPSINCQVVCCCSPYIIFFFFFTTFYNFFFIDDVHDNFFLIKKQTHLFMLNKYLLFFYSSADSFSSQCPTAP